MRIKKSAGPMLRLVGAGPGKSGSVSTISGVENPDGIISHKILDHQLSELLNDLERRILDLEYKYSEVLDTWLTVTEHLVKLLPTISDTAIIDK